MHFLDAIIVGINVFRGGQGGVWSLVVQGFGDEFLFEIVVVQVEAELCKQNS
jgi:hypothetical protein